MVIINQYPVVRCVERYFVKMLFIVLSLIVVISTALYVYKNSHKNYWKKQNIVEYGDVVRKFVLGDRSLGEVYKEAYDQYPGEKHIGVPIGNKTGLILKDLQNVQSVLAGDFESFYSRGIVTNENDILSDNVLFIGDYQRWKLIRQKISPVFTSAKLKNMCYIIERTASDFVDMLKESENINDNPFAALYTYTTASIGASLFGIDTQVRNTMDSPFLEMSRQVGEPSIASNFRFFVSNLSPTLFKLLKLKLLGDHEDFFIGVVKKVLSSRRSEKVPVNDFIDMVIELQNAGTMRDNSSGFELEPTDELLAAQAFFFFLAGTDTSANTMHFTLLELASNPDILKRVHKEVDKAFESNEKITYDVIEKMEYLDMVVNEAIRKYPPIGSLQRECMKDTVLPVGNVKIEKGMVAVIPVFAIHRDENYYPNPDVFDPERFAPGNIDRLPKFGYLPFGEGKRICIGKSYSTYLALITQTKYSN